MTADNVDDNYRDGDIFTDAQRAFARLSWCGRARIVPITVRSDIQLSDLLGIETQKQQVCANVEAFLRGAGYHHMLLWGARGTGKSSLIRALFHAYDALSMVQIACDDVQDLGYLLWLLAQRQERHFLVYIDDLSFAAHDGHYRALKAMLDGSLQGITANVMLCATSNRRHLLAEYHHEQNAVHPDEDVEEYVSLSERFGLRLSFHPLTQQAFLDVVAYRCCQSGLSFNTDIEREALRFALARGSRSARIAVQFVHDYLQRI